MDNEGTRAKQNGTKNIRNVFLQFFNILLPHLPGGVTWWLFAVS